MEDILSGGTIDPSTDGPLPQNVDNRGQDIISEQRDRQQQDSIGGTQFAPRPQPLPPIPQAEEIAPPLPDIPSYNFDFGSDARELARQSAIDVLKNVRINGQGPTVDGSSISFDIETTPSASEAFSFQPLGASAPQTFADFPQPQAQQQAVKAVENIRSFNIEPPVPVQPPPAPIQPEIPEPQPIPSPVSNTQDTVTQIPRQRQSDVETQKIEMPSDGGGKTEGTEDRESLRSTMEDIADRAGLQSSQRSWSNYISPEKLKEMAEKKQEFKQALKDAGITDPKVQSALDYTDGNTPFAPYVLFNACYNGEAKQFLIPAFGPF